MFHREYWIFCDRFWFDVLLLTEQVSGGHGGADEAERHCTYGSDNCRCIYMQVGRRLQAHQSLSDKVQILPVFLLSHYSLSCVHVFPTHSEDTHLWHSVIDLCHMCLFLWRVKEWNRRKAHTKIVRREGKRVTGSGAVKFMQNIWGNVFVAQ